MGSAPSTPGNLSPPGIDHPDGQAQPSAGTGAKKLYQSPKLTKYGTVTEITQFLPMHHHHGHRWMSDD